MSVIERDHLIEVARHNLLDGFEDPNEYNAEIAWLMSQKVDPS